MRGLFHLRAARATSPTAVLDPFRWARLASALDGEMSRFTSLHESPRGGDLVVLLAVFNKPLEEPMIHEEVVRWVLDEAPYLSEIPPSLELERDLPLDPHEWDVSDDGALGIRSLLERPEVLLAARARLRRRRARRAGRAASRRIRERRRAA